jgi:hypothetical protein
MFVIFFVWHYLSHKSYLTPPLCIWSVCAKTTKWAVMYICECGVSILPHLTIFFYWILEMFLQCGIFCFFIYYQPSAQQNKMRMKRQFTMVFFIDINKYNNVKNNHPFTFKNNMFSSHIVPLLRKTSLRISYFLFGV